MRRRIASWWHRFRTSQQTLGGIVRRLARHEWRSLEGHRSALLERIAVARRARSPRQLLRDQLDLVPESRTRFRRVSRTRREILSELELALRQSLRGNA